MKNAYNLLFLTLFCFFVNLGFLQADCESNLKEAESMKVYSENITEEFEGEKSYNIVLKIEGLTENLYAVVSDNYDDYEDPAYDPGDITVNYSNTDNGKYVLDSPNFFEHIRFTVKVYSVDETCGSEPLKTYQVTTDVRNQYYNDPTCLTTNKDLEMCKPFMDNNKLTPEEFDEKVSEENKPFYKVAFEIFINYGIYVLIPIIVISIIYIVKIVKLKRGKRDV